MYSSAYVWAKVLGHMESKLTAPLISTWFDDTEVVELTDNRLVLYSPLTYRKEIILQKCADYIKQAMQEVFGVNVELSVLDEDELKVYQKKERKPSFVEFNPQFTFEKFVIGSSNRFAYAAARAVAENPAESYNPLFIYGPSGLGKTHLLYAIATEVHKADPDLNIVYVRGEQFTNDLIDAIREGRNIEFRSKYRDTDLLLVDDIQFIAGKQATPEEFFHTFNNLYEGHKQIVLTADRPPREMSLLEDRLQTRFEWGLLADIQPPDFETRVAIVKDKAASLGMVLPDPVSNFVAENLTANVRQIEGAVKKILAYHELEGIELNLANVSSILKDITKSTPSIPTPELIIGEVCKFYSIDEQVLRGTQKTKNTAEARQVAMYLVRVLTNMSFPDIGREFGRDHSTAMHAVRKIIKLKDDITTGLQDNIRDITANINNQL